jgi:hypothetical protein
MERDLIKNVKSIVSSDRVLPEINETNIITQISKVKKLLPDFNSGLFQNYKLLEVLRSGKRIY